MTEWHSAEDLPRWEGYYDIIVAGKGGNRQIDGVRYTPGDWCQVGTDQWYPERWEDEDGDSVIEIGEDLLWWRDESKGDAE